MRAKKGTVNYVMTDEVMRRVRMRVRDVDLTERIKEPSNLTGSWITRSQAVARIADRTAKNCRGHVT